jgi:hypothetical protein
MKRRHHNRDKNTDKVFRTAVFHSSKSIAQVCAEAGVKPGKLVQECKRLSSAEPIAFRDNAAVQCCLGDAFEIVHGSVRALDRSKCVSSYATKEVLFEHTASGISTVIDLQNNPICIIRVHRGLILNGSGDSRESVLCEHQMISHGVTLSEGATSEARLRCQWIKQGEIELPIYPTGSEAGFLRLRNPTEKDKMSLPEIVLTSDDDYDPGEVFTKDLQRAFAELQAGLDLDSPPETKVEPKPKDRKGVIRRSRHWTKEQLQVWGARLGYRGPDVVKKTFQSTTQLVPALVSENSDWPKQHQKVRLWPLRPRQLSERCYTDTMIWSYQGKKRYGQLFLLNKSQFVYYVPMEKEGNAHIAYQQFITNVGAPTHFVADNAQAENNSEKVENICLRYVIERRWTEAHKQNQNRAERFVQELKKTSSKMASRMGSDSKYDKYMFQHICYLWNRTASGKLKQRTPYEALHGETPDISNIRFQWWEPVWYYGTQVKYPKRRMLPGRFLGISENTGDECTFLILTAPEDKQRSVISRSLVTPRQPGEKAHGELPRRPSDWSFPSHINPGRGDDGDVEEEKVNPSFTEPEGRKRRRIDPAKAASEMTDHKMSMESNEVIHGEDEIEDSNQDAHSTTDPTPSRASMLNLDAVTGYAREPAEGVKIMSHKYGRGAKHGQLQFTAARPLGGTHVCTFEEMTVDCPQATARYMVKHNVGRRFKGMNGNKPHWDWATEFNKESERVIRRLKQYECSYKEDTTSIPSVGKIRLMQGKKRKRAGRKKKILIQYKYGIRVPATAKEAYELDQVNGNSLWADAIKKELEAIMKYDTFQFLDNSEAKVIRADSDYQYAKVWLIFDVKQDLRRKARLVIGGHMVDPRGNDVYASHMRAESARILMTIADANGMSVAVGDISNAYLYADTAEKIYTTCGEEFHRSGLIEEAGRTALVVKALYGLCGSGHQWWDMLSDTLRAMKFKRSRGDLDVWLRPNGDKYDYVGTHTDDLLVVSTDVDQVFKELKKEYSFKTTEAPEYHLGIDYIMKDGRYQLGSKTYVKEALKRVCDALGIEELEELGESKYPLNDKYRPEEDTTNLLNPDQHRVFQQLVGIGVWLVAIGRFDVGFTVSSLSRFSAYPRQGHLEEVIRMYRYINRCQDRRILVDGRDQEEIGEVLCPEADFDQHYPDIEEELKELYYPRDFPKPLGMVPMTTGIYFDADHAHDRVTGRSITGMVVYVGRTPTTWSSRRQGSVENSTYGAEFIAGKNATEEAIGLRYVLMSLGVPLKGCTVLYGDNKSMIQSSSLPEGQIKKKHVMLAWHKVRETHAAGITQCRWVDTHQNKSNLLTKALPGTTLNKEASMIWC